MTNANWNQLMEDHEVAYLRADVCLGDSESFTLDEKRQICEQMEDSTAEIDAALKADFASMPPELQAAMLDMLCASDPAMADWWRELLIGKMPESVEGLVSA